MDVQAALLVPLSKAPPWTGGETPVCVNWPVHASLPASQEHREQRKKLSSLFSNQGETLSVLMTNGNIAEPRKEAGGLDG